MFKEHGQTIAEERAADIWTCCHYIPFRKNRKNKDIVGHSLGRVLGELSDLKGNASTEICL